MSLKYKIDQEVWFLEVYKIGGWTLKTSRSKIIGYNNIHKVYDLENTYPRIEEEIFSTEKEATNSVKHLEVFISSKNCFKSELKFIEREKKLNRILNGS